MIQYALLTSPAEGGLNNRLQKGYASLRRRPLRLENLLPLSKLA